MYPGLTGLMGLGSKRLGQGIPRLRGLSLLRLMMDWGFLLVILEVQMGKMGLMGRTEQMGQMGRLY